MRSFEVDQKRNYKSKARHVIAVGIAVVVFPALRSPIDYIGPDLCVRPLCF